MAIAAPVEYVVRNKDFTAGPHKVSAGLIWKEFRVGYFPLPFVAYLLAGCVCALILYLRFSSKPADRVVGYLPAALMLLAGACLVGYASVGGEWLGASTSKDLILLFELPLFAVAALDHLVAPKRQPQDSASREPEIRMAVVLVAGVALVACLASWSADWSSLMNETNRNVAAAAGYCVAPQVVEVNGTPLEVRYTPELALDLGNRTPSHVVINATGLPPFTGQGCSPAIRDQHPHRQRLVSFQALMQVSVTISTTLSRSASDRFEPLGRHSPCSKTPRATSPPTVCSAPNTGCM